MQFMILSVRWKAVAAIGDPDDDDLAMRSKHAKTVRKKGLVKQSHFSRLVKSATLQVTSKKQNIKEVPVFMNFDQS
ncbi:hypothetical protein Q3G72_010246 [Acer saccharum]|nr:hypothetical protein Q3G72_010246 [Acer saccharum]